MSYQNQLVHIKIIPRFSVIFKFFRNFVFLDVFASLCVLCVYIFHVISRAFLGASGARGIRRGAFALPRCAPLLPLLLKFRRK